MHLWQGLAAYIDAHGSEILFGVASFHGTDTGKLAQPLSFLHHHHLAPEPLRVIARLPQAIAMDLLPRDHIDRRAAARAIPGLIKSYLRLGGFVGQGAWLDRPFNTTDICIVLDAARIDNRARALYGADTVKQVV